MVVPFGALLVARIGDELRMVEADRGSPALGDLGVLAGLLLTLAIAGPGHR